MTSFNLVRTYEPWILYWLQNFTADVKYLNLFSKFELMTHLRRTRSTRDTSQRQWVIWKIYVEFFLWKSFNVIGLKNNWCSSKFSLFGLVQLSRNKNLLQRGFIQIGLDRLSNCSFSPNFDNYYCFNDIPKPPSRRLDKVKKGECSIRISHIRETNYLQLSLRLLIILTRHENKSELE